MLGTAAVLLVSGPGQHRPRGSGTTWEELEASIRAIPAVTATEGASAGREAYELMRLRDPALGTIPPGIRGRELRFATRTAAKAGGGAKRRTEWQARGPYNVGGRTRGLAVDLDDRNRILAGGVTGGMWISGDRGATWTRSSDSTGSPDVSCLVQDPRPGHHHTWYFGTGELHGSSAGGVNNEYSSYHYHGEGIFKSIDRGLSWRQLPSTASDRADFATPFDVVQNIAVNPANLAQDELLAATFRSIQHSTDGGETWSRVLGSFNGTHAPLSTRERGSYTNIAITSRGVMYAALGSRNLDAGFWRSTDGVNWTDISPADLPLAVERTVFAVAPSDESTVYVVAVTPGVGFTDSVDGGLSMWRLEDNGALTWHNLSANFPDFTVAAPRTYWGASFATQNGYDLAVAVHPEDAQVVYLGGLSLFRSTSGFSDTDSTQWIGGFESQNQYGGSISDDRLNYPHHHGDLHALVFDPVDPNVLYTASDGGVHVTRDSLAPAPQGVVLPWSQLEGYVTTQFYYGAVDHATVGSTEIIGGMQDNSTFLATGERYADPWQRMFGGDGMACAIGAHPVDGWTSYYGSMQFGGFFAHIVLDENHQMVSWNYVTPPGEFDLWLVPMKLDPADWTTLYIADKGSVWRSTDPQARNPDWETVPGFDIRRNGASISSLGVSHDGRHTVYVAQSFPFSIIRPRIYRIDDAMASAPVITEAVTADFTRGGFVHCLAVDPANAGRLIAVVTNYGVRSLQLTEDGGLTWRDIGGNLEEQPDGGGNGPACYWAEILRRQQRELYLVGTSVGLYSTSDVDGDIVTWVQEGAESIGRLRVQGMDVRQADGFVGVTTHGGGAFSAFVDLSAPAPVRRAPVRVQP